ncbi:hypothetical protein [Rhodobacter lacus]|uniref:C2H2-type domain-containing protein n=1 Tax=Rhodobacter lacus TaxID=1641972 RepID=A0ABW5ADW2_9RHOB
MARTAAAVSPLVPQRPAHRLAQKTILCPYCGVPLYTAKDRAEHLDGHRCCCEGSGWDCADLTDPHDRATCRGAR